MDTEFDITQHTPCPWGLQTPILDVKKLTPYEKEWLGVQAFTRMSTPTMLSKKYGLSVAVLKKYRENVSKRRTFTNKVGRPRILDDTAVQTLRESLDAANDAIRLFPNRVIELATETAKRKGKPENSAKVSHSKIKSLKRELGISKRITVRQKPEKLNINVPAVSNNVINEVAV